MITSYDYTGSLLIGSRDRELGQPLNKITVNANWNKNDVCKMGMYRLEFYNNVNTIDTLNNLLYYTFDTVDYTYTSPLIFTRDPTLFAASLQAGLRTQTGDAAITVTYDTTGGYLTFKSNSVKTFQFEMNPNLLHTMAQTIGLITDINDNVTGPYPSVADPTVDMLYNVKLYYTEYLDFCSYELTKFKDKCILGNGQNSAIFYRLYLNSFLQTDTQKDILQVNRTLLLWDWKPYETVSSIDIFILDDRGRAPAIENSSWSIELAMFKEKKY